MTGTIPSPGRGRNSPQPARIAGLLVRKSRAEQDCPPGLRSLDADFAPPSMAALVSNAGSWARAAPRCRPVAQVFNLCVFPVCIGLAASSFGCDSGRLRWPSHARESRVTPMRGVTPRAARGGGGWPRCRAGRVIGRAATTPRRWRGRQAGALRSECRHRSRESVRRCLPQRRFRCPRR